MPTRTQLEIALERACNRLAETDRILFERKANERSLSHKLAIYLQDEVKNWEEGWDVDCEFNRDAQDTGEDYAKQLDLVQKLPSMMTDVHDDDATTVFPDIIVHKRGPGNNLLVVEVKKDTAPPRKIDFDKDDKLPAYVEQLGYQAAAFVLLRLKEMDCQIEWVRRL